MKVVRNYRCDAGHEWIVARNAEEGEKAGDDICPAGHSAVTCRVEQPVEDVQILLVPAARIVDAVKGQRVLDGRYYISILDKAGSELLASKDHFAWDEVLKLAGLFQGKSVEQARRWWERKKL